MAARTIPQLPATESPDTLYETLADAGCLVVTDALQTADCERIRRELDAPMTAAKVIEKDDPKHFYPGRTRRVIALVRQSPTVRELILHEVSQQLSQRHLGANCERIQLHVTAALSVGPGARKQMLHREEDPFQFFPLPRPNLILASMWAISDFTADNGGTLLVPGSHRWGAEQRAKDEEVTSAEMKAGSVLYWLGGTLHGAGANISDSWRYGIILTYSLGWLRQEENQYLDIPPDVRRELSPELRELTGHAMHGGLGLSLADAEDDAPTRSAANDRELQRALDSIREVRDEP